MVRGAVRANRREAGLTMETPGHCLPLHIAIGEAGRMYLNGFYLGHRAATTEAKIAALERHLLKDAVRVDGGGGPEDKLLALEYVALLSAGIDD